MRASSVHRDRLRFLGEHPGALRVWLWHNVEIVHWHGKPTAAAARTLWRRTDQVLEELAATEKVSFVHLVANEIEMPDATTRAVLAESTKDHVDRSALSAVVVNGTGFWASALRGFATSVILLIPKSVQVRICGSPAELIPWFPIEHARRTGIHLNPEALVNTLVKAQSATTDAATQTS
jgi:hypothetical protein